MPRLRDEFNLSSKIKYLFWRLNGSKHSISCVMRNGGVLQLRPKPTDDLALAYEIFIEKVYAIPNTFPQYKDINYIVDLGANIGYSCLYWCLNYPNAKVLAFEPHPLHVDILNKHLEINNIKDKVTVVSKAVGVQDATSCITDCGINSALTEDSHGKGIRVPVVDFYKLSHPKQIDLLKMDIEGTEYDILNHAHFGDLDIRLCVFEWHTKSGVVGIKSWCVDRLKYCGYNRIEHHANFSDDFGLIWASRD